MTDMSLYPWQQGVWSDLGRRHQQGGLPHALMFTGPRGVGKQVMSLMLARWLLCSERDRQSLACERCHSCQLWAAGNHPDFMLVTPEDGGRQIRIDSVRQLNEFLSQTPQISRCQVVILRPAEVLNHNAANALLKTLEEPPGESFILLESERFGSVLPTIRSRCQRVVLPVPAHAEAMAWLQQQGRSADQAADALRHNQGAPLAANAWLEDDGHAQHRRWLEELATWCDGRTRLDLALGHWKTIELEPLVWWMNRVAADLLRAACGASNSQLLDPDVPARLGGATLDRTKLLALQSRLAEVLAQVQGGAGHFNRQLLVESLLIDWRSLITQGRR
ncbi:DNA polymerase III subunit delta' [Parathalassolituus penaei]|nr:DNA polymerase III subunit delta' [Parathalassolituus penaei]